MLSQTDKQIIYNITNLSNMRFLSRKYNNCKRQEQNMLE